MPDYPVRRRGGGRSRHHRHRSLRRGKNAIEDHFDVSSELEAFLAAKGKHEMLEEVKKFYLIDLSYVRQGEPLGLGHAAATKNLIGDQPFAEAWATTFDATPPALRQMLTASTRCRPRVIGGERVPQAEVSSYGIKVERSALEIGPGVHRILDMVEKPPRDAGAVEPRHHRPLPADC